MNCHFQRILLNYFNSAGQFDRFRMTNYFYSYTYRTSKSDHNRSQRRGEKRDDSIQSCNSFTSSVESKASPQNHLFLFFHFYLCLKSSFSNKNVFWEHTLSLHTRFSKHPILGDNCKTKLQATLVGTGKILFLKHWGCRELQDRSKILLLQLWKYCYCNSYLLYSVSHKAKWFWITWCHAITLSFVEDCKGVCCSLLGLLLTFWFLGSSPWLVWLWLFI